MTEYRVIRKDPNYYCLFNFGIIFLSILSIFCALFLLTPKLEAQDIMPFSEVRAGMNFYGLTVFKGTDPEKFEGIVLGTKLPDVGSICGSILVELKGGPKSERGFILEETNVMMGMSGSPIYSLDGKILGSIAAIIVGSKRPQAFVTPIECTLNFRPASFDMANKWIGGGDSIDGLTSIKNEEPVVRPGDIVSFCNVWGDHRSCFVATVIMVDPKDQQLVYLTGHVATDMAKGMTATPFFRAEVVASQPNIMASSKLAKSIGEPIGTVIFNGPFGSIAKLGVYPKYFNFDVALVGLLKNDIRHNYNLTYSPSGISSLSEIINNELTLVDNIFDVEIMAVVVAKELPPINLFGRLDYPLAIPEIVSFFLGEEFEPNIEKVRMVLAVRSKYQKLDLEEVSCRREEESEENNKYSIKISATGKKGFFENNQSIEILEKYKGKKLNVASGEHIANRLLSSNMAHDRVAEMLNKVANRNSLYIFYSNEDEDASKSEAAPMIIFAQAKMSLTSDKTRNVDVQSSAPEPAIVIGKWTKHIPTYDFDILHQIPVIAQELGAAYYITGDKSFTVPAEEENQDKKKKKKRFIFF